MFQNHIKSKNKVVFMMIENHMNLCTADLLYWFMQMRRWRQTLNHLLIVKYFQISLHSETETTEQIKDHSRRIIMLLMRCSVVGKWTGWFKTLPHLFIIYCYYLFIVFIRLNLSCESTRSSVVGVGDTTKFGLDITPNNHQYRCQYFLFNSLFETQSD